MPCHLRASVYVSAPVPFTKPDGTRGGEWSPISSTLIYGENEAVLVDTAITKAQNVALGDWIEATISARRLSRIYITHGHADHWLGVGYLKNRFPGVKVVATPGTIKHMEEQIEPELWNSTYGTRFPGLIDTDFVLAEPLTPNGEFTIDGHKLKAVEVGHSDTHDSTVLWAPSIKLAVCGDVVYGDVHQQFRYANTKALREEWISAIERSKPYTQRRSSQGTRKLESSTERIIYKHRKSISVPLRSFSTMSVMQRNYFTGWWRGIRLDLTLWPWQEVVLQPSLRIQSRPKEESV